MMELARIFMTPGQKNMALHTNPQRKRGRCHGSPSLTLRVGVKP